MAALAPPCTAGCLTFRRSVANVQPLTAQTSRTVFSRPSFAQPVEARVVIRFARFGRKKLPFYRIVAIDSRARRDGRPIEYLGWYDPLRKETNLNAPSIKKWLSTGAQPSDTVRRLLERAMVMDAKPKKAAA